jgi:hypothetical protein
MLTKDFIDCTSLNRTNRKVFRLILCEPVKTIANNHELWMLREIEGVGIFDSLDLRSAFAPTQARSATYALAYQGLLRAIYCRERHCPEPCNARAKKASIE